MKTAEQLAREAEHVNVTLIPMFVVFERSDRRIEEVMLPAVPRKDEFLYLKKGDGTYGRHVVTQVVWFHWPDLTNTRPRVELHVVELLEPR